MKKRAYWFLHELTYKLYVWAARWWMKNAPYDKSWWGDRVPSVFDQWRCHWQDKLSDLGYAAYGQRLK